MRRPALLLLALLATPLQAEVFTVTKTADTLDGACDTDCSLREAVSAANAADAFDIVVVPPGIYVLTRAGAGEDLNATGDLDIRRGLVLVGAGPGSTVLDGAGLDRVLDVHTRAEVFGVTVRNGRVDGNGGGIVVQMNGDLLLRRSVVSGNRAQNGGDGGGIASLSRAEVRESAVLQNQAAGDGGGIAAAAGIFTLRSSTISENLANGSGGGLSFNEAELVTVSGSTVAVNGAGVSGGGVYARPSPFPGPVPSEISGSVLALNTAPEDPDCHRARSTGHNVIGVQGSCWLEPTDRSGTRASPLDPRLGLLSGAFGPTPVRPLLDGSPAFDLVPASFCEPADQVGQGRPGPCDAGAWERTAAPVCVPGGSVLCLQGGRFRVSVLTNAGGILRDAPAVPVTDDTGNYWFFSPENLELMVKVLDGCAVNQRWWVFTSGLTDAGVLLRVDDLGTGRSWTHFASPARTYPPRLDTDAFECAPAALPETASGEAAETSAVLVVTKAADTLDGACDHDCSLREAVTAANAREGMDVILLGPGVYTLTREGRDEDQSAAGDLDVRDGLFILGAGQERTVLDGGGIDRVLHLFRSLDLHDVTVRNGRAVGHLGGGIFAFDRLSLVRSVVTANRADEDGGGICAGGELEIRDSTVSGNRATDGGGILAGFAELENVTVSGNQADARGGGIFLYVEFAVLEHVTITGNSAVEAGGLFVTPEGCQTICPSPFYLITRTVVAGNTGGNHPDCAGLALQPSGGGNVFGVRDGCGAGSSDLAGTRANPLDPRLGPLGFHGGPTPTHVPLAGSPLLDRAPCPVGKDQRGRPRPAPGETLCDAGSAELLPGACQPDEETLCLGAGDRFEVTVRWATKTDEGSGTGSGKAVPLALDTGAFWFFQADNLELTVKALDGCGVNNRFWVFLSGLTDAGVEVTVRDTKTGKTWTHNHAAGTPFQPRLDTNALEVCP